MTKNTFNKVAAANDNGGGSASVMDGAADLLAHAWKKQKNRINAANDNPHPDMDLLRAAEHGDLDRVREALDSGANIDARHTNNDTPLIIAVREGHAEIVEYLLSRTTPSDITLHNNEEQTALHVAARENATEIALLLLRAGALTNGRDETGATPAFYAAQTGNEKLIEALAAEKADIDTPDDKGNTPLMQAIRFRQGASAEALIAAGAKVDAQDPEGMTALMLAIEAESLSVTEGLLEKGADMELKNKAEKSAMAMARESGNLDLINALEHAAKRLHAERYDAFHTGTKSSVPAMKRLSLKPTEGKP